MASLLGRGSTVKMHSTYNIIPAERAKSKDLRSKQKLYSQLRIFKSDNIWDELLLWFSFISKIKRLSRENWLRIIKAWLNILANLNLFLDNANNTLILLSNKKHAPPTTKKKKKKKDTKLYLMVRLQFWSCKECGLFLHCHFSDSGCYHLLG